MTKFLCGATFGLALASTAAWAVPTIFGNGILLNWTVTTIGPPGSPRIKVCIDPTVNVIDQAIECP